MDQEDYLPLSGIQHFAFCPRQWALIHIEQQWAENVRTVEGQILHQRVNDPYEKETRGDLIVSRAMPVISHTLKLKGIADAVEFRRLPDDSGEKGVALEGKVGKWAVLPVEYKRGKPKVDERDAVQLCAQAMCLEEMFETIIDCGDIYYGEPRRREQIECGAALRETVRDYAQKMYAYFRDGITPSAETGLNCKLCSLVDICVPKLTKKSRSAKAYVSGHINSID